MSNITFRPRAERLAHGARTARELEQYAAQTSLRASVRFERPAFNRSAWEAVAAGFAIAALVIVAQAAGLL